MLPEKKHNGMPGPRPRVWKCGPDPIRHAQYVAWARARAQAHYRNERWHLTFAEWVDLWQHQWHLRGRTRDTVCLSRRDYDLPWSMSNCEIITRRQHNLRQKDNTR